MESKVLVADDEQAIAHAIAYALKRVGFVEGKPLFDAISQMSN